MFRFKSFYLSADFKIKDLVGEWVRVISRWRHEVPAVVWYFAMLFWFLPGTKTKRRKVLIERPNIYNQRAIKLVMYFVTHAIEKDFHDILMVCDFNDRKRTRVQILCITDLDQDGDEFLFEKGLPLNSNSDRETCLQCSE